jgi:hypothetical protein
MSGNRNEINRSIRYIKKKTGHASLLTYNLIIMKIEIIISKYYDIPIVIIVTLLKHMM